MTKIAHFYLDKSLVITGIYSMTMADTSQVEENVAFDPNKLTQAQKWKLITKLDSRTELHDGTSAISVAQ